MRPLGEYPSGEHGWHRIGGGFGRMVFGPIPEKVAREREARAAAVPRTLPPSPLPNGDGVKLIDPWRERR